MSSLNHLWQCLFHVLLFFIVLHIDWNISNFYKKNWIWQLTNKKGLFQPQHCALENMFISLLAWISSSMHHSMKVISLLNCLGAMEVQVTLLYMHSSYLHYWVWSLILTTVHRFSVGFRSGEFTGQSSTVTPIRFSTFGRLCRSQVLLDNAICISIHHFSRAKPEVW